MIFDNEILFDLGNGYHISNVTPDDKAAYVKYLTNKEIYANTQNIPYPYTEADADYWIAKRIINASIPTLFAIRKAGGELIGSVDSGSNLKIGTNHSSEIGYWVAAPYWNRGLMTKAVGMVGQIHFQ